MNSFSLKLRRWLRRGESGQSVILLAIGFIALVGFVGITTDVALMFVRYSQLSRAVDAAAIAAANQMRQDRTQASLGIAARQFIELYGLNPTDVLVDTCLSIGEIITDELCTEDQSKLVRVTAQIVSPTIFMRLLGFQDFVLQASSLSQTAALDVVIIMDASESMSNLTTVENWADIRDINGNRDGQGVVYRPPRLDQVFIDKYPVGMVNRPQEDDFWMGTGTITAEQSILNTWQQNVNNRLYYADGSGNVPGYAEVAYNVQYNMNYFNGGPGGNYGPQRHPRLECRVRFFQLGSDTRTRSWNGEYNEATKSYVSLLDNRDAALYAASTFSRAGFTWNLAIDPTATNPPSPIIASTRWDGFVPTYNYHGCCNDPNGDKNFSDLICQPFKQARDAVLLFMDRVDFGRGDRMAFVTFDRTAFLVNPFGYLVSGADCPAGNTKETCRPGAMIESVGEAKDALRKLVGVRAEPNFYVYAPGNITNAAVRVTAQWSGFAAGLTTQGQSRPVNYAKVIDPISPDAGSYGNTAGSPSQTGNAVFAELTNFPVWSNCPFKVAGITRQGRTMFLKGVANSSLPNATVNPGWANYVDPNGIKLYDTYPNNYNVTEMSYDYWASCRGSNIGAGLREASNALLNPKTIRKSGTVWVMILLANGGAGGSDPVRRNRNDLLASQPYAYNSLTNLFGASGDYGAHGLCPYGIPSKAGELLTPGNDNPDKSVAFPYCSDESPRTRNFCNFRPLFLVEGANLTDPLAPIYKDINTGVTPCSPASNSACLEIPSMGDAGYVFFDPSPPLWYGINGPQTAADELQWNRDNNNVYDVDLTGCEGPKDGDKQLYYDADDYAHDWADYIGLRKDENSSELLPSIFTIGFGTEFETRSLTVGGAVLDITDNANAEAICSLNVSDCLGEQLLRYIADVGDNNKIDNDYYQAMVRPLNPDNPVGKLDGQTMDVGGFGPRDPCQRQDQGPDVGSGSTAYYSNLDALYGHLAPQTSCGNYYYAPDYNQLQIVFDDIASRMFTRLSR